MVAIIFIMAVFLWRTSTWASRQVGALVPYGFEHLFLVLTSRERPRPHPIRNIDDERRVVAQIEGALCGCLWCRSHPQSVPLLRFPSRKPYHLGLVNKFKDNPSDGATNRDAI